MNWYDKRRPRNGKSPCWLGSSTALQDLLISPEPMREDAVLQTQVWSVGLWVGGRNGAMCFLQREASHQELLSLLSVWPDDPEGCVRDFFSYEYDPGGERLWAKPKENNWPTSRPVVEEVETSAEDLGL